MAARSAGKPLARGRRPRLHPENRKAWEVFLACLTQMNCGPMGGVIGLRYEALPFIFSQHEVEPDEEPDLFEKLRILERFYTDRANAQIAKK
jgi:hypothetical protein